MSTRVWIALELADGVQPTMFNAAMANSLETNPAVKSWAIDCADDEADWTEEELAHLVQLGPEKTNVSVEETRHLYLRISSHLKIPVRKQELALYEFLSVSPVISGQKELHRRISQFRSTIFREVVFEDSSPKVLTTLYAKLRKKLEDSTSSLIARRGVYGFRSCERPTQGREAQERPKDSSGLLDPRVPLDRALNSLVDED